MMEEAENMGIRVDWFENVIGRTLKIKDCQFAQKVNSIKERMEAL